MKLAQRDYRSEISCAVLYFVFVQEALMAEWSSSLRFCESLVIVIVTGDFGGSPDSINRRRDERDDEVRSS